MADKKRVPGSWILNIKQTLMADKKGPFPSPNATCPPWSPVSRTLHLKTAGTIYGPPLMYKGWP